MTEVKVNSFIDILPLFRPLASLPESKGLPGMRTGRPYTTFELEQIRAAQKKSVHGLTLFPV